MVLLEWITLPDLQFKVEDILVEGGKVAYRLTVIGAHKGEFQDVQPLPTRKSLSVPQEFQILCGCKVGEDWVDADVMGLMQQIGAIPVDAHASNSGNSSVTHS